MEYFVASCKNNLVITLELINRVNIAPDTVFVLLARFFAVIPSLVSMAIALMNRVVTFNLKPHSLVP